MVQIDIEMPIYCYDCPCHNGENGCCNITGDSTFDKRPFDCPLKEEKNKMDDLISRREAINALCDNCDDVQSVCPHYPCKRYTALDSLPSAKSEPKKGKWICHDTKEGYLIAKYSCSICDYYNGTKITNFCPNCGADMRGERKITND